MRGLIVLLFVGVALAAHPQRIDHDIKMNVYDMFANALKFGVPIKRLTDEIKSKGEFHMREDSFREYLAKVGASLVAYRPKADEDMLHAYYIKAGDVADNADAIIKALDPLIKYASKGKYVVLTPMAAKTAAPKYFNMPVKRVFHEHLPVDINKDTPFVIVVPEEDVPKRKLDELVKIGEYGIDKYGNQRIHEFADSHTRKARTPIDLRETYIEAYGEPREFFVKGDKSINLYSPAGFRLVNVGQYDINDPIYRSHLGYDTTLSGVNPLIRSPISLYSDLARLDAGFNWQRTSPSLYGLTSIVKRDIALSPTPITKRDIALSSTPIAKRDVPLPPLPIAKRDIALSPTPITKREADLSKGATLPVIGSDDMHMGFTPLEMKMALMDSKEFIFKPSDFKEMKSSFYNESLVLVLRHGKEDAMDSFYLKGGLQTLFNAEYPLMMQKLAPLQDYLFTEDHIAVTPKVAETFAPEFFKLPIRSLGTDHIFIKTIIYLDHPVPFLYVLPERRLKEQFLPDDAKRIAEYKLDRVNGVSKIHEKYFDM